jgi:aspartate aminotransferase
MILSKLSESIKPSPTLTLNTKAAKMKQEGKNVIHLGGGEPKSFVPEAAIERAINMLKTRVVRYTPVAGTPEMKKAVIYYTEKYYDKKVTAENVIVSSGAKQTLMVALQAVLDPGDEVIFPAPYWVSYPDMVKLAYGNPVAVKPESPDFQITLDEIKKNLSQRTKVILLNSPNNPSGKVYSEEFLKSVTEFCEENDLLLIMDEIYRELIFSESKHGNTFNYSNPDIDSSNVLVVNGISKQYAMTGFRIGWGIGAKKLISAMTKIQGHQTSCSSSLSQTAAVGAIYNGDKDIELLRESLERKRDILVKELSKIKNVKLNVPHSTFYSLVDFSAYEKDSHKLAEYLIEKAEVVTVPGKDFGIDGHLRISFCGPEDELIEGLRRIGKALENY